MVGGGGDGWKAEDKLSFRQRSEISARGERRTLLCGRTVDKWTDGRVLKVEEGGANEWGGQRWGGGQRQWETKKWRVRREGPQVHNPLTDSFVE